VLEAGCGGGWFTKEFMDRKIDILALEGTKAGLAQTARKGIPPERLLKHDLRLPLDLNRRFQVAVCTEVAEHIECPFAGQLVKTLTNHADVVWFSFEPPGTNDPHYHHCNEQPFKFWLNLFKFYGYQAAEIPDELVQKLAGRGRYIFYNANVDLPAGLARADSTSSSVALGQPVSERKGRRLIRKLLPPIIRDWIYFIRKGKPRN